MRLHDFGWQALAGDGRQRHGISLSSNMFSYGVVAPVLNLCEKLHISASSRERDAFSCLAHRFSAKLVGMLRRSMFCSAVLFGLSGAILSQTQAGVVRGQPVAGGKTFDVVSIRQNVSSGRVAQSNGPTPDGYRIPA